MTLKKRTSEIIRRLNEGIHEREEIIAVSFLAALSDQNIFLFGPPGTAKSLIARRIALAFETRSYFEYLMHRFSTPEDVFGPVSITELKKDNFLRKTEGFLPRSDFAFLDEIWKSSPSILNTLLTIINEKRFRNGTEVESAQLKALIAASNETPPPGQGLDALYDRFLVRLNVAPMEEVPNFNALLKSKPTLPDIKLPAALAIKHEEWEEWGKRLHEVDLSEEVFAVIRDIRLACEEKGKELDVYASDRRWQRAAILLKAAAFFCGRDEVNLVDCLLLRHCLWTTKENYEEVVKIVEDAVRNRGFETGFSLHEIDAEKEELEKEINKELYHRADVYKTSKVGNRKCFECREVPSRRYHTEKRTRTFYIPTGEMKGSDQFNPIDKNGNILDDIRCRFDGQGTCQIEIKNASYYNDWNTVNSFTPKVLFHKGDRKTGVNARLIESLHTAVDELRRKLDSIIEQIEARSIELKEDVETPFVPVRIRDIALEGVDMQLKDMKLRRKDCDRLSSMIGELE